MESFVNTHNHILDLKLCQEHIENWLISPKNQENNHIIKKVEDSKIMKIQENIKIMKNT